MNDLDLFTHTLRWVYGYCTLWNQLADQFDPKSQNFQDFVHRTHSVVHRHLQGRQNLDGSCSDMECNAAIEAKQLFKQFFKKED